MYTTIVKLKKSCEQNDGKYLVTFKYSGFANRDSKMLLPNDKAEFVTNSIQDAINNLDLEEIEELHITKYIP